MREHFAALADALTESEDVIVAELAEAQGEAVDIGGYYQPDAGEDDSGDAAEQDVE